MNSQEAIMVICPDTGEHLQPEKVWQSYLPTGQRIVYAQFKLHYHWQQECPWSYMVVQVDHR
jgi:hypothetical protein